MCRKMKIPKRNRDVLHAKKYSKEKKLMQNIFPNVQKKFYVSTVVKFANLRKNTKSMNKNVLKDFKDPNHAIFATKCLVQQKV